MSMISSFSVSKKKPKTCKIHLTKDMMPYTKAIESSCLSSSSKVKSRRRTSNSRASTLTSIDTNRCTLLVVIMPWMRLKSISKWQTLTPRCKNKSMKLQGPWSRKYTKKSSMKIKMLPIKAKKANHSRCRNSMSSHKKVK